MYQVTDSSTQHGSGTPHGPKTPHRMPAAVTTRDQLLGLNMQLYPTGRVWNLPENGNFYKFHQALNLSLLRLINSADSVIDHLYPDNPNFTTDDATLEEFWFGIETNLTLTLQQRKAVLLQRWSYRNGIRARQSLPYIQSQLTAAGFNVTVYANMFVDGDGNKIYKTPTDILGTTPDPTQFGAPTQFGGGTHFGGGNFEVIANSDSSEDYSIGGDDNLWATFFIAGNTLSSFATVPKSRLKEFRTLVLQLKPAETVAYIFINFL